MIRYPKFLQPTHYNLKSSQKGMSSVYIIILIMTIYLAVMLSGGSASLFSGNIGSPITPTPTPSPAPSPSTSTSPTTTVSPTPVNSAGWSISINLGQCLSLKPPRKEGTVTITGNQNGYVELIKLNPQSIVSSREFKQPSGNYPLSLTNDLGFDTSSWKIAVYSGGTNNNGVWAGGTLREETAVKDPTGCN